MRKNNAKLICREFSRKCKPTPTNCSPAEPWATLRLAPVTCIQWNVTTCGAHDLECSELTYTKHCALHHTYGKLISTCKLWTLSILFTTLQDFNLQWPTIFFPCLFSSFFSYRGQRLPFVMYWWNEESVKTYQRRRKLAATETREASSGMLQPPPPSSLIITSLYTCSVCGEGEVFLYNYASLISICLLCSCYEDRIQDRNYTRMMEKSRMWCRKWYYLTPAPTTRAEHLSRYEVTEVRNYPHWDRPAGWAHFGVKTLTTGGWKFQGFLWVSVLIIII